MRRALRGLLLALVLFVGLTTAFPCDLSYPNVKRFVVSTFTVATLQADCEFGECSGGEIKADPDQPACGCNSGSDSGQCQAGGCNVSWPGCGPAWAFSCDGRGNNRGIFF